MDRDELHCAAIREMSLWLRVPQCAGDTSLQWVLQEQPPQLSQDVLIGEEIKTYQGRFLCDSEFWDIPHSLALMMAIPKAVTCIAKFAGMGPFGFSTVI